MSAAAGTPPIGARAFAWLGALCFFASLSYFLFSYEVTYGETPRLRPGQAAPDSADPAFAITINVVLFTVFALHHSVFARERIRQWVARAVTSRLERSFYVWVASVMFIAVCALWQPVPGIAWQAGSVWRWPLIALQLVGIWLSIRSAAAIDILELSGVRQLSPSSSPREMEFKTSGPYGWVRHPIYTGWFLMVFCAPLMTMTRLVFAVVSCAYLLAAIPFEERSLVESSNGAYDRYSQRVRWKLLPGVY
jgi:protein-S-isoprenylcysteine O-methyltransferase Ste14